MPRTFASLLVFLLSSPNSIFCIDFASELLRNGLRANGIDFEGSSDKYSDGSIDMCHRESSYNNNSHSYIDYYSLSFFDADPKVLAQMAESESQRYILRKSL